MIVTGLPSSREHRPALVPGPDSAAEPGTACEASFEALPGFEQFSQDALNRQTDNPGWDVFYRDGLADLLRLVFEYDAARVLNDVEAHNVMTRYAARDVIRMLARLVLDGGACTPERFSEMVTALKTELDIRGRELFHPLRLALAGRSGEGDLDRVILLIDAAWESGFAVKTVRERMVEFCSVME